MSPIRVAVIEHRPPSSEPTLTEQWAKARGHGVDVFHIHGANHGLPDLRRYDFLVVMGGVPNVHEHEEYPWLVQERELIQAAMDAGKPVLGVCLGAQQLATVLGGRAVKKRKRVRTWAPVSLARNARLSGLFPDVLQLEGLHSHEYGISVPKGCITLLTSRFGPQGFQLPGRPVVGILTHFETTRHQLENPAMNINAAIEKGQITREEYDAIRCHSRLTVPANHFFCHVLDQLASYARPRARHPTG